MAHPWEDLRARVHGLPPREAATQVLHGVIAQIRIGLQHGGAGTLAELLDKLEEMAPSMIDATEHEAVAKPGEAPAAAPPVPPVPPAPAAPAAAEPKEDQGPHHLDLPMHPPAGKDEAKPDAATTTRQSLSHTHDTRDTHPTPTGKHGKR